MDFQHLSNFVRIAEAGNLSRAAATLHIAQPTLSKQVQTLEAEFKQRLFVRNGRGVEMTEAGERLLEHAQAILQLLDRTYDDMENSRTGKAGTVMIGMPGTLSSDISAFLIRRLKAELPDANVHILHGRSTVLQQWVMERRLDMALIYNATTSPTLEVHNLVSECLHVFSAMNEHSDSSPVSLRELSELPIIIASKPNTLRGLVESALSPLGLQLNVASEIDALSPIFDLVNDRLGCTIGTMRTCRKINKGHKIYARRIEPELVLKVQIILRAQRLKNRLHDTTFRILKSLSLDWLKGDLLRESSISSMDSSRSKPSGTQARKRTPKKSANR